MSGPRLIGRKQPYTEIGISRRKCVCGKPAMFQWNCCANDNRWVPVCLDCDIALNEMALALFRIPGRRKMMARYREKLARGFCP